MKQSSTDLAPPSDDKRWRIVNATMRRHGYAPGALIEALHTVQESFGYLDETSLKYVASSLRVPLSRAYGVVTFYHFFSLRPPGEHSCVICTGTACYIKGSLGILDALSDAFHVEPGETSDDGRLSLLTARCMGSCGLAPAAVIDDEVTGKLTAESAIAVIRRRLDE